MPKGSRDIDRRVRSATKKIGSATQPQAATAGPSAGPSSDPSPKPGGTKPGSAPPQPPPLPPAPPTSQPQAPPGAPPQPPANPASIGRGIGGEDIQAARTFATVGGQEAARRGISGSVQSGRSLFNNPGQNVLQAGGPLMGRQRRGVSLTRGVGAPGDALSAESGEFLQGEEEPGIEQLLQLLSLR